MISRHRLLPAHSTTVRISPVIDSPGVQAEGPNPPTDFRGLHWLRYWGPVFGWGILVWTLSTKSFSENQTSHYIVPALHWLLPNASLGTLLRLHHWIRKGAHVIEYFLFSLLVFHGIRGGREGWHFSWALMALALSAGFAASDELHQLFVPHRGASPLDVLLDTLGAGAGQMFGAWWHRTARPIRL